MFNFHIVFSFLILYPSFPLKYLNCLNGVLNWRQYMGSFYTLLSNFYTLFSPSPSTMHSTNGSSPDTFQIASSPLFLSSSSAASTDMHRTSSRISLQSLPCFSDFYFGSCIRHKAVADYSERDSKKSC